MLCSLGLLKHFLISFGSFSLLHVFPLLLRLGMCRLQLAYLDLGFLDDSVQLHFVSFCLLQIVLGFLEVHFHQVVFALEGMDGTHLG